MEITFCEMRDKEIINLFDGKRLGRVIDLVFDQESHQVLGVVVPGLKKFFSRKMDDIFIPLSHIEKIGDDVILVKLTPNIEPVIQEPQKMKEEKGMYSQFSREIKRDN